MFYSKKSFCLHNFNTDKNITSVQNSLDDTGAPIAIRPRQMCRLIINLDL